MIRKPLTCPTCGDVWKRVVNENLARVGPSTRECRACWTRFSTGAKEWADMDRAERLVYFAQNIVVLVPLALLGMVGWFFCFFFDVIDRHDAKIFLLYGVAGLAGAYLLLCLLALPRLLLSLRRTRRSRKEQKAAEARGLGGRSL